MSNLAVASFSGGRPQQLAVEQILCTPAQQRAASRAAKKTRDRQRGLDRSRRNTNANQYGPSVRQRKRAARRAVAGLPAKRVANPGWGAGGPRRWSATARLPPRHALEAVSARPL